MNVGGKIYILSLLAAILSLLNFFSIKSLAYGYCLGDPCGWINMVILTGSITFFIAISLITLLEGKEEEEQ